MVEEQERKKEEEKFTFIYMKQVPKKTADEFVKLSNDEFSGHFGFCLKALLDQLIIQQQMLSELRLEEIEDRLLSLEKAQLEVFKGEQEEKRLIRKRVGGEMKNG